MIADFGNSRLCLRSRRSVDIARNFPLFLFLFRASFIDEFQEHPLPYIRSYSTRHVSSSRTIINLTVAGLNSLSACKEAPYSEPIETLESSVESLEENAFMIFFLD